MSDRADFVAAQAAALRAAAAPPLQSCFVDSPGVGGRAHVLSGGAGPPVVLLPGIGTPAAMFAPLLRYLDGFRIHAVDLPGFGLTDATPGFADDLRANAVRFVDDVLDALGLDGPAIVGSSLGSLFSMWHVHRHPERVRALAHVGCPAIALGTSAPLPMRLLGGRALGRLLTTLRPASAAQVRSLAKMVHEHPLPPTIADLLLATERLPHGDPALRSILHRLVRIRGPRPGMALTGAELASLDRPSLLVFGRDDPMGGPDVGRRLADALPDAELRIVDGGHAPWLHHADQVGPAVASFLEQQLLHRSRT